MTSDGSGRTGSPYDLLKESMKVRLSAADRKDHAGFIATAFLCVGLCAQEAHGDAGSAAADATPRPGTDSATSSRQVTLSLIQAEALLLDRNLAIASARSGLTAAQAGGIIAAYRPNPALTMSAEQFNVRHPFIHLASEDPASQGYQHFYTVRVDQLLERGDKRNLRILNARLQGESATAQLQDVIRQELFVLRNAYLSAVQAKEILAIAQDMLTVTDRNETIIKGRVQAGDAAQTDLLSFQVNRLQFQQALITAQQTYAQALSDVLNVLNMEFDENGTDPGGAGLHLQPAQHGQPSQPSYPRYHDVELALSDNLDAPDMDVSYDSLRACIDTRPDVVAAQQTMLASEVAGRAAQALTHEDLGVGLEYQRNGGDDTVGVAFQINLPFGNDHQGDILQAEAQYQQARNAYHQELTQARTDIGKAWVGFRSAKQLIVLYNSESLAKAKDALRIAAAAYKEGGTALLDLFAVQQAYDQTAMGYVQARCAYRVAIYQLEMAVGKPLPIKSVTR